MTPEQALHRRTRRFAEQRRAARARVDDVVHLTSFAGRVAARSTAEPTPGYPDGAIVLELTDGLETREFKFRPAQEVLLVGAESLERYDQWRASSRPMSEFAPEALSDANRAGLLF